MHTETVTRNLNKMDDLDFSAWNGADWTGVFSQLHRNDVLVEVHGYPPTHGIDEHIEHMKTIVHVAGEVPQIKTHPIKFGEGDWTCVVGEFETGSRMVTVAKWVDGAIAEEYIWM